MGARVEVGSFSATFECRQCGASRTVNQDDVLFWDVWWAEWVPGGWLQDGCYDMYDDEWQEKVGFYCPECVERHRPNVRTKPMWQE